jgi:ribonucleoside-triphosphate reductase
MATNSVLFTAPARNGHELHGVNSAMSVRKRDGLTLQPFDTTKIQTAISKAWLDCGGCHDEDQLHAITNLITTALQSETVDVEQIQDAVEVALMRHKQFAVAKAYILYRQKRAELRASRRAPDPTAVSDYIHFDKYARYRETLGRRELYLETIDRVEDMHQARFAHIPGMAEIIHWAFDRVREKRVLPSMRSMQFGGEAILKNNCRIYNCSFSLVDRPRVFAEALFLLLCGSGVGFSVQYDHVDKLPALKAVDPHNVVHHTIADTIEGWADALDALINSYIRGYYIEFNYSQIRPEGALLKTSGGKAPGHVPLKRALEAIRRILDGAAGRKLRPIECYDIFCLAADAVLSGGIRRSAMLCLFSIEDAEMMYAKTGQWGKTHPWRQNSNNSVILKRDDVKKKQFKRIFQMSKEWGEPGFYFTADLDYGANPCVEIGMDPTLVINDEIRALLARKLDAAILAALKDGERRTGWSFCNLCEQNAQMFKTFEDFVVAAKAATIIGTCQAAYTSMPYLGWVSEAIAERDALLGISMTGMMDSPQVSTNPDYQRDIARMVKEWNADLAARIGIRPAARTTCVKPGGTTSLELGCVASGHGAHHAHRFIRRVVAKENQPVFQRFRSVNPHMCVRKPNGDWVVEFPVQPPDWAIVKDDLSALDFLKMVKSTQLNWVLEGIARSETSPGLTHNVSNTVQVQPHEWEPVADYLWENRAYFTGVALLSATGDKDFAFAPHEAITTEADEVRWNQLVAGYQPVDYTMVIENEAMPDFMSEAACAAGKCLV